MSDEKNSNSASDEDGEIYEVEALLKHRRSRTKGNKIDYLVKWHGYPKEYDTWEAESNILSEELVAEYWNKLSMSRSDFLKGKTTSKTASSSSSKTDKKRKVETAPVTEEPKKKAKIGQKKKTILSNDPPKGLKWEDIIEVVNIYNTKEKDLFAEIRWKNEERTYALSNVVRQHNPIPLLNYYQTRLIFK